MDAEEQTVAPGVSDALDEALARAQEVPRRVLATYARLWQLETWLRQMVYVELRAAFGNTWQQQVAGMPATHVTSDLRLTHMPTPEKSPISYITFGILLKTIGSNWNLFEPYLPPQDLWTAKLIEVSQIRNRVAHFRRGHGDDIDRVLRLMRDIDQGFWKFCTSYNQGRPVLPPSKDPVTKRFQALNQFPFVKVGKREWAMAGVADRDATFNLTVNVLRRPWLTGGAVSRVAGESGYLYDITIGARDRRTFDYPQFLQDTRRIHESLVHICLDSFHASVRVTIPALLGTKVVNEAIQDLIDWLPNSLHRSNDRGDRTHEAERLAEEWPEYVLGPKNPLCFLGPDMPCSFFSV